MRRIVNHMKSHASMVSGSRATVRMGLVSSYDPNNYCCKVRIQPEDVETGWLPIASPWVGNGWGMFAPPHVDDMVDVHYQEGDFGSGFVVQRFFNDTDRPVNCVSGVLYLIHETGSCFKLENDGTVSINGNLKIDATAPTINITATGNVNVAASNVNVTASGAVTVVSPSIILKNAGSALRKLCTDLFLTLYNSHTHPVSGSTTNQPNQQASVGTHTTNIVQAE